MNEFLLSDLKIGMNASFETVITEKMMSQFMEMSGDTNPLHVDKLFAKEAGYNDRVVYGLLTSSFLSKLVGIYLPGKYCLLRSVESKYIKPAYVNDKLTVYGEIEEINENVKLVQIRAEITNGQGEKILKAKIKVGLTK